jgi:signal transduction histidine kinase
MAAGDRALLERLVVNLIQNAVRYNQAGGWLCVSTHSEDGHAVLEVANAGPEITQEEAKMLATPFGRLGRERTGSADGSGLGLSGVESVVRAHGGSMRIVAPGTGLVVTIRLPAHRRPVVRLKRLGAPPRETWPTMAAGPASRAGPMVDPGIRGPKLQPAC